LLSFASPAEPLRFDEFAASLAALARFEPAPFLTVAVSGGPDSLALAILADRWARGRAGEICALTVDHRLRPESGAETRRLGTWLSARGIRHEVLVWSGEKPKTGIQEAARAARYRLLDSWCREHGCLHLLTGHHRDDQIETHLIRRRARSGADGLAGMSAIRELSDCRVLRPLLGIARDRLVAFLQAENQPFIADPSNLDPAFERSRYRQGEASTEGGAGAADLASVIRALGTTRAAREHDANALLARRASVHPAGFAVLDPSVVSAASHELAARLVSAIATTIGGLSYTPRRERIARLREVLATAGPRGHTLGGCRFIRWRERVLVMRELGHAAQRTRLNPGDTMIWDRRFQIVLPPNVTGSFTIGYPGEAGVAQLRRLAPRPRQGWPPRLLLPVFPVIWDEDGIASVPHLGYRREQIGAVPRVVFRPANPLTQAGFAVV
jgi:tRNA(Ile)-lysidine synthase